MSGCRSCSSYRPLASFWPLTILVAFQAIISRLWSPIQRHAGAAGLSSSRTRAQGDLKASLSKHHFGLRLISLNCFPWSTEQHSRPRLRVSGAWLCAGHLVVRARGTPPVCPQLLHQKPLFKTLTGADFFRCAVFSFQTLELGPLV